MNALQRRLDGYATYLTKRIDLQQLGLWSHDKEEEVSLTIALRVRLAGTTLITNPFGLSMNQTDNDLSQAMQNMAEGVTEYLDNNNRKYGKIYVSPYGVHEVLKELEKVSGEYRKTILRRFQSKRKYLEGWYVITGDLEPQPDELCLHCDEIDDMLFKEDCWLERVNHNHSDPIKGTDIMTYRYKGVEYTEMVSRWKAGYRPHKET